MDHKTLLAYRAPNVSRFLTQFERARRSGLQRHDDKRLASIKQKTADSSTGAQPAQNSQPRRVIKISATRLRQVQKLKIERTVLKD